MASLRVKIAFAEDTAALLYKEIDRLEADVREMYIKLQTLESTPPCPVGTKLRWSLSPETYREAVVNQNGVLQTKSVTDGAGDCLDGPIINGRLPLKITLFPTEADWRASLPDGEVTVETPEERMSRQPLSANSDWQKLAELQNRFMGGAFYISGLSAQKEIYAGQSPSPMLRKYIYVGKDKNRDLSVHHNFDTLQDYMFNGKLSLMVHYNNKYISLSHLL